MSLIPGIYELFVRFTARLLPFAAWVSGNAKLKQFTDGRRHQKIDLSQASSGRRYWFHCASLGEFEQARPVMEALKKQDQRISLIVSFFSPSGYEQKKSYPLADAVYYLPLDTRKNARAFISAIQPDVAVFIKYEIWYFFLSELSSRKIKTFLLSAVFRKNQFIFSWQGAWLFEKLKDFQMIFLQDEASYQILKEKGLSNLLLNGDTRYDRVKENAMQVKFNSRLEAFKGHQRLLVLGSSWQSEEFILQRVIDDEILKDYKILIAPHDIGEKHLSEIEQKFSKEKPIRYTLSENADSRIMILDTIGHLASAYFYADIALIGGAFGKGLHNILEALAFGVPVIFGPKYQKHPEGKMAIDAMAALSISDEKEFLNAIRFFTRNEEISFAEFRTRCTDFISLNSGACKKALPYLSE